MKTRHLATSLLFINALSAATLSAQEPAPAVELPSFLVESSAVALEAPAASFAAPISRLRFEPRVDLQTRGFAEGQADVTIRGGTFENSGFTLGGLPLLDPQTGHYFADIPVDPDLLTGPEIFTGAGNALRGFNANTGTIAMGWRPLQTGGVLDAALGNNDFNQQRASLRYAAESSLLGNRTVGVALTGARSEGDGTIDYSDHSFERAGLLLQVRGESAQTDFYAGYQDKYTAWPGAYTANPNFKETDHYQLTLVTLSHKQSYEISGAESDFFLSAGYRKLDDDYELNTLRGRDWFRPYQHETEAALFAAGGKHAFNDAFALNYGAYASLDAVESTELTFAGYQSRTLLKGVLLPEWKTALSDTNTLTLQAGGSYDTNNRGRDSFSPILRAALDQQVSDNTYTYYIEHARTSQVAGYTALASNPNPAGAFAGNPNLDRAASNNYEIGVQAASSRWRAHFALFYRQDHNLADWTFDFARPGIRKANAVDLDTWGAEALVAVRFGSLEIATGYAYLDKGFDYGTALVNGSFYALNYAQHRGTLSAIYRFTSWLEVRTDAEARYQFANPLRTSSNTAATLSGAIIARPPQIDGLEISLIGDNLTNSNFQEFPGTPADGRQLALRLGYSW